MGPIIIQWSGEGPPSSDNEAVSLSGTTRALRMPLEGNSRSAAQQFYLRQSNMNRERKYTLGEGGDNNWERTLQEGSFRHLVTFDSCVFRVSVLHS